MKTYFMKNIFHEKHFRYPMNSLSSLFYLLLLIYCSKINNYGIFLLVGLTILYTIWSTKSTEIKYYFDLVVNYGYSQILLKMNILIILLTISI